MNAIEEKIKQLESFQKDVEGITIELSKEYKAEIIDMNTAQLEDGKEATGQSISPGYRPLTIRIKREKGQPTNKVTLKDTGEFHKQFDLVFFPTSFVIVSDDDKAQKLERKYGKDIYGLNEKNLQELIDLVKPDLIKHFRKLVA